MDYHQRRAPLSMIKTYQIKFKMVPLMEDHKGRLQYMKFNKHVLKSVMDYLIATISNLYQAQVSGHIDKPIIILDIQSIFPIDLENIYNIIRSIDFPDPEIEEVLFTFY